LGGEPHPLSYIPACFGVNVRFLLCVQATVLHYVVGGGKSSELRTAPFSEAEVLQRVLFLLNEAKADHRILDKNGESAVDVARRGGLSLVVKALEDHELEWQVSRVREQAQARKRAMVVGGVWGGTALLPLMFPPIFAEWASFADPTATLVGDNFAWLQ
jgi:hypothetical protein